VRRFNDAFRATYGRPPTSFRGVSPTMSSRQSELSLFLREKA
jgi:hypothetical protein